MCPPSPTDLQLRILSAGEAQNWIHNWPTTAVISLVDPSDRHLIASSPRPNLDRLEILVADVTDPEHPHAATAVDIERLITFGKGLAPSRTHKVLLHCRGGVGRSPAAAMICLTAAGWPAADARREVTRLRPEAKFNGWMILLADRLLTPHQRDGLFSSYLAWAHQQPWWYPLPMPEVRDAIAGRLSWQRCIDLVKAQTHRTRGIDFGPHR